MAAIAAAAKRSRCIWKVPHPSSRRFRGRNWGKAFRRAAERMAMATATGRDDVSATPWWGIALAASTPFPLPALERRPRSTWLARSSPWCCGCSLAGQRVADASSSSCDHPPRSARAIPVPTSARMLCSKAPSAEYSRNQVTLAFRLSSIKRAPWRRVMFAPGHCLQAASYIALATVNSSMSATCSMTLLPSASQRSMR
jgi:hypothetical protein